MAAMDQAQRDKLKQTQFADVDKKGGEHLPINDEAHLRNAMARWNQTNFESKTAKESARKKIVAAARKHGIEVADDDKGRTIRSERRSREPSERRPTAPLAP